jgi:hypothetical protein
MPEFFDDDLGVGPPLVAGLATGTDELSVNVHPVPVVGIKVGWLRVVGRS